MAYLVYLYHPPYVLSPPLVPVPVISYTVPQAITYACVPLVAGSPSNTQQPTYSLLPNALGPEYATPCMLGEPRPTHAMPSRPIPEWESSSPVSRGFNMAHCYPPASVTGQNYQFAAAPSRGQHPPSHYQGPLNGHPYSEPLTRTAYQDRMPAGCPRSDVQEYQDAYITEVDSDDSESSWYPLPPATNVSDRRPKRRRCCLYRWVERLISKYCEHSP
ncbi:hypothetical protein NEOLEDRAFT_1174388 [Neolentinus lepideus HHB14362 ss-1]|uniref:Uncharacterized protein n=1 Tax=Neolentinus lepideus HHB14362 ss-1 TaxID=1314782 RepID=A0A165VQR9_9AGAM|nr:hypothetical protein NEOLEDRAFT_1174388 [Neolentinus lepideus HHB14362 ss-1]